MSGPLAPSSTNGWRWDLFCRVIDNYGDAGVCWRLAADLAARGHAVRLWMDDTAPLRHFAPSGAAGVQVLNWGAQATEVEPADVVVEAFGCDPPADFVARMAAQAAPPAWINLEYLSAEAYVERSHRLPSPQLSGPGAGLTKHFFYPGFTPATGGLLREPGLMAARQAFDRETWLAEHGWARRPAERVVVAFCYESNRMAELVAQWQRQAQPTLLLAAQGPAATQLPQWLLAAPGTQVRGAVVPWLRQPEFDRLLWSADLAFVRGEDSFVRAQWAGVPFVWQIYVQHDGAHRAKLEAFLRQHLRGATPALGRALHGLWHGWNGLQPGLAAGATDPAALPAWAEHCRAWRHQLLAQDDLVTQLLAFVGAMRQRPSGHAAERG